MIVITTIIKITNIHIVASRRRARGRRKNGARAAYWNRSLVLPGGEEAIAAPKIMMIIHGALAAAQPSRPTFIASRTELAALAARSLQTPPASAVPTSPASPTNSSTRLTVPRTRLIMGSPSVFYNGLFSTTSAMSKAAVGRASALASASSSSTLSGN